MNFLDLPMEKDAHSFYEPGMPRINHLHWLCEVDFDTQRLHASVTLEFNAVGSTMLDTWNLEIVSITDNNARIPFVMGAHHKIKGCWLSFTVPESRTVKIEYKTASDPTLAKGLQWLSAELCGGKPFVYTQGEAINARSYIPCQDTPSVKFSMGASLIVPDSLRGLVAAPERTMRTNMTDGQAIETWFIQQPIPSYLIAFAVGDLVEHKITDRMSVWAQPHMIDAAAHEFRDLPKLLEAGEQLFGAYPFGRYSVLVMPFPFPYGGMENPCLSFLTPALVAGDGSGITTVAHELAHSWTGNLITNADWNAFWLNEGWTVYAEFRITEAVYGREAALVHLKLLELEFRIDCEIFRSEGRYYLTALCPNIDESVDPDEIFSRIPYFKGCLFLLLLEKTVGREQFDAFMRSYIHVFPFSSIGTKTFLVFAAEQLGAEVLEAVRATEWVYGEGLPDNAPLITSIDIVEVQNFATSLSVPSADLGWGTSQLQLYLELLYRPLSAEFVRWLDEELGLSSIENTELRWSFLTLAVQSGYEEILPRVGEFLHASGRKKYLEPLYRALYASSFGREFADQTLEAARGKYHPVAVSKIEDIRRTILPNESR